VPRQHARHAQTIRHRAPVQFLRIGRRRGAARDRGGELREGGSIISAMLTGRKILAQKPDDDATTRS